MQPLELESLSIKRQGVLAPVSSALAPIRARKGVSGGTKGRHHQNGHAGAPIP